MASARLPWRPGSTGPGSAPVSVPVLSSTATSAPASRSSAVPSFRRTPRRNSAPLAAIITLGTARPSAQGQVMISTAVAMFTASRKSPVEAYHATPATSARRCTTGA